MTTPKVTSNFIPTWEYIKPFIKEGWEKGLPLWTEESKTLFNNLISSGRMIANGNGSQYIVENDVSVMLKETYGFIKSFDEIMSMCDENYDNRLHFGWDMEHGGHGLATVGDGYAVIFNGKTVGKLFIPKWTEDELFLDDCWNGFWCRQGNDTEYTNLEVLANLQALDVHKSTDEVGLMAFKSYVIFRGYWEMIAHKLANRFERKPNDSIWFVTDNSGFDNVFLGAANMKHASGWDRDCICYFIYASQNSETKEQWHAYTSPWEAKSYIRGLCDVFDLGPSNGRKYRAVLCQKYIISGNGKSFDFTHDKDTMTHMPDDDAVDIAYDSYMASMIKEKKVTLK